MGLVVLLLSTCASYAPELHNLSLVIFFETICLPADDIIPFLDRAIACRALIPARFICNLRNTFLDEKLVDAKLLSVLISSHEVFNHPALASARGAGCHFSLVLLSAAQRQVCSGTAEEQTWEILRLTFLHIMDIFTQDPDVFSSDMDMGMVTREYYHYLILLAARALRPAAMDTLDRIDSLNNVMIILTTSAQLITEDPEFPPELNLAFRTSVHQVWNRAHDGLAAISRAEAPQKWKVLKWWRDFGSQCGVDLDAPYVPPTPAVGDEAWTKDMGCAWRECLCFGERPDHALRKCKRCERVLYCSKKCQTQDWNQGGHKQVCRRVAS
ncbi:zinc finger MYND domain-containing protein [Phanerochaete sordida]|uniref:Zinc finger MYND domain-containing protein n=1 Tax=Phanerochaete sordida TaxID=48140 RepID=A0A9P3LG52_9APHY|nr:zinc finger MYND domain-containing protein [Phanerochaete sordida]